MVHSHYWLWPPPPDARLAREWDAPHVAMFHTLADVKLLGVGYVRGRARGAPSTPSARLVHDLDRVVVATEHEMHLLGEMYGVPRPHRVAVIPLGRGPRALPPARPQLAARAARSASMRGTRASCSRPAGSSAPKGLDVLIKVARRR